MDDPGRGSLDCCLDRASSAMDTSRHSGHRHLRSPARVRPVKPIDTLANDPITRAPPQKLRRLVRVMRRRCLSRGVPLPDAQTIAAWPDDWSFPRRPAALMGFVPSQVCSRHGWTCISARPGPRAFSPRRPTRLIFVGLIRLAREVSVREWAMTDRGRVDVGFWASLPFAVRVATHCPGARTPIAFTSRSILPWALPLTGLRVRQVLHPCVSAWARPRANHQPPDASLDTSHPLMGFGDPSR